MTLESLLHNVNYNSIDDDMRYNRLDGTRR